MAPFRNDVKVQVQTCGSGSDLRFRFTQSSEPGPPSRFGSPILLNPDLHIRSGSGATQVHKVRTSNRGQYIPHSLDLSRHNRLCYMSLMRSVTTYKPFMEGVTLR